MDRNREGKRITALMSTRAAGALACAIALAVWIPACAPAERAAPRGAPAAAPVLETIRTQRTLEDCPEQLAPCASISLEYLEVRGGSDGLRAAVEAFLDTTVFAAIDESGGHAGAAGADTLMRHFLDGYRDFVRSFPEAPGSWSIRRTARAVWNDRGVVSLEFVEESYTGGAHPNTETKLISLDAADGRRLLLGDLLEAGHDRDLVAAGERAFRAAHGLAPGDDLVAAGFWFEDGRFSLTDNFALTADGLRFHYNAYEIAPYAMGPTDMTLPRASLTAWARRGGPLAPSPPA